jgi:hypothetical protein
VREQRDNSGTLGKNERREKDTHPTHTGKCVIEGKEFWVSAWVKESARGKFFSLSFKPKEATRADQRLGVGDANAPVTVEFDDDIPF